MKTKNKKNIKRSKTIKRKKFFFKSKKQTKNLFFRNKIGGAIVRNSVLSKILSIGFECQTDLIGFCRNAANDTYLPITLNFNHLNLAEADNFSFVMEGDHYGDVPLKSKINDEIKHLYGDNIPITINTADNQKITVTPDEKILSLKEAEDYNDIVKYFLNQHFFNDIEFHVTFKNINSQENVIYYYLKQAYEHISNFLEQFTLESSVKNITDGTGKTYSYFKGNSIFTNKLNSNEEIKLISIRPNTNNLLTNVPFTTQTTIGFKLEDAVDIITYLFSDSEAQFTFDIAKSLANTVCQNLDILDNIKLLNWITLLSSSVVSSSLFVKTYNRYEGKYFLEIFSKKSHSKINLRHNLFVIFPDINNVELLKEVKIKSEHFLSEQPTFLVDNEQIIKNLPNRTDLKNISLLLIYSILIKICEKGIRISEGEPNDLHEYRTWESLGLKYDDYNIDVTKNKIMTNTSPPKDFFSINFKSSNEKTTNFPYENEIVLAEYRNFSKALNPPDGAPLSVTNLLDLSNKQLRPVIKQTKTKKFGVYDLE